MNEPDFSLEHPENETAEDEEMTQTGRNRFDSLEAYDEAMEDTAALKLKVQMLEELVSKYEKAEGGGSAVAESFGVAKKGGGGGEDEKANNETVRVQANRNGGAVEGKNGGGNNNNGKGTIAVDGVAAKKM